LSLVDDVNFCANCVYAYYLVAITGKTSRRHGADIAQPENANSQRTFSTVVRPQALGLIGGARLLNNATAIVGRLLYCTPPETGHPLSTV